MKKLPKAKCRKCENCKLISYDGGICCDFLNNTYKTDFPPRYCPNFQKRGKK